MEKKKQIGEHIVDHLSERMNEEIVDPVLDEWLAEDESNQEDFKRYKEIWKETGSYLEQETFNAQYAWDKIDRINKKRYNKRKRLVNIGYIISGCLSNTPIFEKPRTSNKVAATPEIIYPIFTKRFRLLYLFLLIRSILSHAY